MGEVVRLLTLASLEGYQLHSWLPNLWFGL